MEASDNKLISELNKILVLTKDNKIPWSLIPNNPSGVTWDRVIQGKTLKTTIQGQNIGNPNPAVIFYYFTIVRMLPTPQDVLLQINTQLEPIYKDVLKDLYAEALIKAKDAVANIVADLSKGL
jgi:hypothetical protein